MKIAVVITAYGHQEQLNEVIRQLPDEMMDRVFVVDDGSNPPITLDKAQLIQQENKGYGGAQKTGYSAALETDCEGVALIHGDNQYDPTAILGAAMLLEGADLVLGSRMISDNGTGMPWWRRAGNRLLTKAANIKFGTSHTDLHTGARIFRRSLLEQAPLPAFSSDFIFDQQLLVFTEEFFCSFV